MSTAKVFMSGRSQAVRLPKEFRFETTEVTIKRVAGGILLSEGDIWESCRTACADLDSDTIVRLQERTQPPTQKRAALHPLK